MKIIFLNYSSINLLPPNNFFKIEEEKNWKKERKMKRVIYFKITLRPFNFFFRLQISVILRSGWFLPNESKNWQVMPGPWFCEFGDTGLMVDDRVSDVDRTSSSPREPAVPRWRASRGLWSVRRVFQFSRTPVSESGTRFPWLISRSWSLHVFTIFFGIWFLKHFCRLYFSCQFLKMSKI